MVKTIEQLESEIGTYLKVNTVLTNVSPHAKEIAKLVAPAAPLRDGVEYQFTKAEFAKFIEWCRVNGSWYRGNLQKNGIEIYQEYLKQNL